MMKYDKLAFTILLFISSNVHSFSLSPPKWSKYFTKTQAVCLIKGEGEDCTPEKRRYLKRTLEAIVDALEKNQLSAHIKAFKKGGFLSNQWLEREIVKPVFFDEKSYFGHYMDVVQTQEIPLREETIAILIRKGVKPSEKDLQRWAQLMDNEMLLYSPDAVQKTKELVRILIRRGVIKGSDIYERSKSIKRYSDLTQHGLFD